MVFADGDVTWVNAFGLVLGTLGIFATAIAGAYAIVTKAKGMSKKDEIDGWRQLVQAHEENAARRENIMQAQSTSLELEQRSHVQCLRGYEVLRSALFFVRDFINRQRTEIKKLGGDPGEPLDLPEIPDLDTAEAGRADFLARQIQQTQQVVTDTDKAIAQKKAELERPNANPGG